jgi:hypothetical protein
MARFRKSSHKSEEYFGSQHRFEHWYRDNTIYFITARCRDQVPAFESEHAKRVFWDRFDHYTKLHGFTPFVTSLPDNHYHTVGHLLQGEELGKMMQKIHGSVAKLVNDLLTVRLVPFWVDSGHQTYFDGCLRDVLQLRRSYGYTLTQAVRHGIVRDWRDYPHTRVTVDLEGAIDQAFRMRCFLGRNPVCSLPAAGEDMT